MTPDEDPFIAALAADPADETTRLVYADWLEERCEDARAGYLRAEVAHFRASAEDRRNDVWCDTPGLDPVWAAMVSRTGVLVPGLTFTDGGPKITRADLEAIEHHWGRPLPPDYAAFLLLYNGGRPSRRYLWTYLDDEDYYAEVHFFSTVDAHLEGPPFVLTTPLELIGGVGSDPEEQESLARMMPIGTLTDADEEENILALALDPPPIPSADRIFEIENGGRRGPRRAHNGHTKETFHDLLYALIPGP
jgi:uncharacterized protein (TIGR02996 family)